MALRGDNVSKHKSGCGRIDSIASQSPQERDTTELCPTRLIPTNPVGITHNAVLCPGNKVKLPLNWGKGVHGHARDRVGEKGSGRTHAEQCQADASNLLPLGLTENVAYGRDESRIGAHGSRKVQLECHAPQAEDELVL